MDNYVGILSKNIEKIKFMRTRELPKSQIFQAKKKVQQFIGEKYNMVRDIKMVLNPRKIKVKQKAKTERTFDKLHQPDTFNNEILSETVLQQRQAMNKIKSHVRLKRIQKRINDTLNRQKLMKLQVRVKQFCYR